MSWRQRGRRKVVGVAAAKPLARSEELVVEELDDTLLIYDLKSDRAHSLGASAARVWRCCDGDTAVEALSAEAGVDPETTQRALAELEDCGLLGGGPGREEGSTRREATVKLAKLGAAAASVPLIASIAAPAEAQTTATCSGNACFEPSQCAGSGCCCCFGVDLPCGTGPKPSLCCVTASLCADHGGACVSS